MEQTKVLIEHVITFRGKIDECAENFDITLFYKICRLLVSETGEVMDGNLTHLKQRYTSILDNTKLKDIIIEYFNWYFDFLICLRELNNNFVTTIYRPLFEYYRRRTPESCDEDADLSKSRLSLLSIGSALTERSTASPEMTSKKPLKALSNEYRELKQVYDYTNTDNIADRLKYIVERVHVLVEEEEDLNEDLFTQESETQIKLLDRSDDDLVSLNLLRLVPDVLAKLNNAGKLAYMWLISEDSRISLAEEKLKTITTIEEELVGKIAHLHKKINNEESELLAKREEFERVRSVQERSANLAISLYDIDKRIQIDETFLESLRNDQQEIKNRYSTMKTREDKLPNNELRAMKISYEKNKLRILNWEQDLSKLKFQRSVTAEDFHLKLELDPDIANFQDSLRDKLVSLEATLNSNKSERSAMESALTPIIIEKRTYERELRKVNDIEAL